MGSSHLGAVLRLVLHGLRKRGGRMPDRVPVPRSRVAAERAAIPIDSRRVGRYLAVTDGERISSYHDPDPVLPPTYAGLWETALALDLLVKSDVPFPSGGLIHLGGELIQLRPLRIGDRVRCRLELERAEPHSRGIHLTLLSRNWNEQGQLCLQNTLELLLRTREGTGRGGKREASRTAEPATEPACWRELARWKLRAGQGRRYARVSGDFNPIHLWAWTSRPLGYPRPVLHGFCTEAMVANALVERLLGADASSLRRLRISFRAPLPLPSNVRLLVEDTAEPRKRRFRVVGEEEGRRPFAEGEFVGQG